MVIDCPGKEWVAKFGSLTRTNVASSRKTAEEGALRQVRELVESVMAGARPLGALLKDGATCAGDCGEPQVEEMIDTPTVVSYPLPDGKWFSIASSGQFGLLLRCHA